MGYDKFGRNTDYVDTAKEFRDTASRATLGDKASTEILSRWIHEEQKAFDFDAVANAVEKQAPGTVQKDKYGRVTGLVFSENNQTLKIGIDGCNGLTFNGKDEKQVVAEDTHYLQQVNDARLDPQMAPDVRAKVQAIETGFLHHDSAGISAAVKSIGANDALGAQVAHEALKDLVPYAELSWVKDKNGVGQLVVDQTDPYQKFSFGTDGSITKPVLSSPEFGDVASNADRAVRSIGDGFHDELMTGADNRHRRYLGSNVKAEPAKLGELLRTSL